MRLIYTVLAPATKLDELTDLPFRTGVGLAWVLFTEACVASHYVLLIAVHAGVVTFLFWATDLAFT